MKTLTLKLGIICMLALSAGCTKGPINEDIEGFWMLKSFTTMADGETHHCERLFFGITRMVTEISEKQGEQGLQDCVARTEYNDDQTQLILRDFKQRGGTYDNGKNATPEQLQPFGINNQVITVFEIIHCNGCKMTLQSDYARLELEKF